MKTIVVTGANSGIGHATAELFLSKGELLRCWREARANCKRWLKDAKMRSYC